MHGLIIMMAKDMGINKYTNESDESFTFRVCYSALGQWCLATANNKENSEVGTTKNYQTRVVNELLERYAELCPDLSQRFVDENHQVDFSVYLRRIYEETGYLITTENRNRLANYGRTIQLSNSILFFGLPEYRVAMNGLGVFDKLTEYNISLKEFLIRDSLDCKQYLDSQFNFLDFHERDINLMELEFFNPTLTSPPSYSWGKKIAVEKTMARKSEIGPYYRVMKIKNEIEFAEEVISEQNDSFVSYEYRRLLFALKHQYGSPLKAHIGKIDEQYSRITIRGHLPNREHYFMLLVSWPEKNAFDRANFIIKNSLISDVISVLENIGISISGGENYA
jgi:hypothetical protein